MGVYRRGNTYWARWREDGVERRRSLGTRSKAEAERLLADILDAKYEAITVAEVLKRWVAFQTRRRKPRSVHAYRVVLRRFTLMWGDLTAEDLTRAAIEEAQEAMLTAGLSPRTVNHQVGLAVAAIRWAHERDLVKASPPAWRRLPVGGRSPRKYLTGTELRALFDALATAEFERLRPVIMLAAYAGLRMGEIIWLEWKDVDLDEGWLHIRAKKGWSPKTAASHRSIPMTEELAKFLSGSPTCNHWVAPRTRGAQWNRRHLGVNVRRLFDAAGVDDGGPHTLHRLRGTFATEVLRSSGDLRSLQSMLGHGNLSVTSVYLSEVDEHKRAAVRGLQLGSR